MAGGGGRERERERALPHLAPDKDTAADSFLLHAGQPDQDDRGNSRVHNPNGIELLNHCMNDFQKT